MKKILLTAIITLIGIHTATAQVGIGTEAPKTSLQVVGKPASTTTADGVQVPSLSLAQLDAKITAYGTDQNGTIVYIDDVTVASTETETAKITATGYYYYEASNDVWKAMGGSSSSSTTTTYSVGDFAHGGVVFAVDESGQHGLVCAIENQSLGIPWSPDDNIFTKARGNGIYAGKSNTIIIISVTTANYEPIWWNDDYAALICAYYNGNGFSDWYLPSKIELQLMYLNRDRINENAVENEGKIFETNNWYWSSTEQEGSGSRAWAQKFSNSFEVEEFDKREIFNVRAVRAF